MHVCLIIPAGCSVIFICNGGSQCWLPKEVGLYVWLQDLDVAGIKQVNAATLQALGHSSSAQEWLHPDLSALTRQLSCHPSCWLQPQSMDGQLLPESGQSMLDHSVIYLYLQVS